MHDPFDNPEIAPAVRDRWEHVLVLNDDPRCPQQTTPRPFPWRGVCISGPGVCAGRPFAAWTWSGRASRRLVLPLFEGAHPHGARRFAQTGGSHV